MSASSVLLTTDSWDLASSCAQLVHLTCCACCGFCLLVSVIFRDGKVLSSTNLVLLLLLTCCHLSRLHGLKLSHLLGMHEAVLSHGDTPWLLHLVHLLRHQLLLSLLLDRL